MLGQMLNELAIIDEWLDDAVSQEYKDQPLAQDWARVCKVIEELGEAINELILMTGQNPRKERKDGIHPLLSELADTAITAILGMQHFTKDKALTGSILVDKVQMIGKRAAHHKRMTDITTMADGDREASALAYAKERLGIR